MGGMGAVLFEGMIRAGSIGVDEVEGNRGGGRITGEEARASEEVEGEMEEEGTAVAAPVAFL